MTYFGVSFNIFREEERVEGRMERVIGDEILAALAHSSSKGFLKELNG